MNRVRVIKKLLNCFHGSYISNSDDFIVGSFGFSLCDCQNLKDIYCNILEWLSGPTSERHEDFYILQGINRFCSTNFSRDEMREIYFRLGNAHNHKKTLEFVKSDFDMNVLK